MQSFSFLAILSVLASTADAQACTAKGQNVTASGFVMDNFCIKMGTLVDNPTVMTLKGPEVHSIHCLVDLKPCVESNFALLAAPANGSDMYSVKYQLGATGSALAKAAAESARSLGGKTGFSVTVTGIDDGTPELKCIEISKTVVADGKSWTLPSNAAVPSTTATTAAPTTQPAKSGVSPVAMSGVAAIAGLALAFAL